MKSKFKKFYNFFILIIAILNLASLFVKMNKKKIKFKSTEVTIKVKGTGNVLILSEKYFNYYRPNKIYINNISQSELKNEYYFNDLGIINLGTTKNNYYLNDSEIVTNKTNNEYYPTDQNVIKENLSAIEQYFNDLDESNKLDEDLQLKDF